MNEEGSWESRSVAAKPRHAFDVRPGGTNSDSQEACSVVVNVYARTRLRVALSARAGAGLAEGLAVDLTTDALTGSVSDTRAVARLVAPSRDLGALVRSLEPAEIPKLAKLKGSIALPFDPAKVLAVLEEKRKVPPLRDEILAVVQHGQGPSHVHVDKTTVPGAYHVGLHVAGRYCPEHGGAAGGHDHVHGAKKPKHGPAPAPACGPDCEFERFSRLLAVSVGLSKPDKKAASEAKAEPVAQPKRGKKK